MTLPAAPRPHVVVNMASSLDGKIALAPALRPASFRMSRGPEDHRRMRALRASADAVMIGAGNARVDDPDLRPLHAGDGDEVGGERVPIAVLVTRRGAGLGGDLAVFGGTPPREVVVAHAATMPADKRVELAPLATLVELGEQDVDVVRLLAWLARERGVEEVLCEGGGTLNASLFAAGCVDALALTLVPRVLGGGGAPTVVDGAALPEDAIADARLESVERWGDELFLRYVFGPARAAEEGQ